MYLSTTSQRPGVLPGLQLGRERLLATSHRPVGVVRGPHVTSNVGLVAGCNVHAATRSHNSNNSLGRSCFRVLDSDQPGQQYADYLLDALPAVNVAVFERAESAWQRLCTSAPAKSASAVTRHQGNAPQGVSAVHHDVLVLGSTLGIIAATAMMHKSWQLQASSSSSGGGLSVAVGAAAGFSSSSSSSRSRHVGWGINSRRQAFLAAARGATCKHTRSSVAAAAGHGSSSSSSSDRRKLEQLLLQLVDRSGTDYKYRTSGDPLDKVISIDGPPSSSGSSSSSYGGADSSFDVLRLLYPQLDPSTSLDETDIIDWSDVPNNGWGSRYSSSSSSSGGGGGSSSGSDGEVQCCGAGSSSRDVLSCWGNTKCRSVWAANGSSSSSGGRRKSIKCLAAAAASGAGGGAAAGAGGGGLSGADGAAGVYHSVDADEDSLLQGYYDGADSADQGLCNPHQPLCNDPAAAAEKVPVDDIINWSEKAAAAAGSASSSSSKTGTTPAAAAAAPMELVKKVKTDSDRTKAPRPYMNIVNGRWVPPSKSEAERMMQGHTHMGPDEGV